MQDVGLFWQLTIKTLEDLKIVSNENLTLEMYVMQLIYLKNLDERKETVSEKELTTSGEIFSKRIDEEKILDTKKNQLPKNQLKNTNQVKTKTIKNLSNDTVKSSFKISSFKDLIKLAETDKEIQLKYDLERNVKLVSFNYGKIDISFNEELNKNFIKNLTEKLLLWTGERWIIS